MSEVRILKEWDEWPQIARDKWFRDIPIGEWENFQKLITLPLRMPDEWTPKQLDEFGIACQQLIDHHCCNSEVALKALEIATSPAPEPDPWEEVAKAIGDVAEHFLDDGYSEWAQRLKDVWQRLKKSEGKS